MRHLIVAAINLAVWCGPVAAGSLDRLRDLANSLSQAAEQLVAEGYRGFVNRGRGTRADVDALFYTQQFSASASLFRQLIADNRPVSELRDAAAILQEQIQGAARFGFGRRAWRAMETTLGEIVRELGRSASPDRQGGAGTIGRLRWRGRVDDEVLISVQGAGVTVRTIAGADVADSSFDFTSPLPQQELTVEVRKRKGRGSIEVIQQPSRFNSYVAVVRITDNKRGQDNYEFELVW